ncbi:family 10 glycosylhydrolase [Flavobacterium sp. 140616W15]|uniref:family 10 glycosylhydrolase n=1 Tax=Flavobacterium sp. 140616W15 TaxID=2478552 RepID=UPI001F5D1FCF|nr:family 10 glycosylhydrolase [Flavobacterium sp. 140616W15]
MDNNQQKEKCGPLDTVDNIDWPSKPGLSEEMKAEMITILDNLRSYNLNTVVFQIRPTADAYYKSTKEQRHIG